MAQLRSISGAGLALGLGDVTDEGPPEWRTVRITLTDKGAVSILGSPQVTMDDVRAIATRLSALAKGEASEISVESTDGDLRLSGRHLPRRDVYEIAIWLGEPWQPLKGFAIHVSPRDLAGFVSALSSEVGPGIGRSA